MELIVLGSSSDGNCYLLKSEDEVLIIEAGINFKKVQEALDFNISNIVGCLISHEHSDHSKHIGQFQKEGAINCYSSKGTFSTIIGLDNNLTTILQPLKTIKVGKFKVLPFDVQHNVKEPFGFLIQHPECGNLLFVTDTSYLKPEFKNLHNIMIECNYSDELLNKNLNNKKVQGNRGNTHNHMSLKTTLSTLKANDLKLINNIVLLHLSKKNANPELFKEIIEKETGKRVTIAGINTKITINRTLI